MEKDKMYKFLVFWSTMLLVISVMTVAAGAFVSDEELDSDTSNIVLAENVDREKISLLNEMDLEIVDRYGNFALIDVGEYSVNELEEVDLQINRLENRGVIHVNGETIDLDDQNEGDVDIHSSSELPDGESFWIIQLIGPINPEWRTNLEGQGVDILDYTPNYAYRVRMETDLAKDIMELDYVDNVVPYRSEWKIHPNIEENKEKLPTELNVRMIPEKEIGEEVLSSEIKLDGTERKLIEVHSIERIEELSEKEEVLYISPHVEPELHAETDTQTVGGGLWFMDDEYEWSESDFSNNQHREGDPDTPYRKHGEYGSYMNQLGYTGEDVTQVVADTGLGTGEVGSAGHPDFTDRVIGGYGFGEDEDYWGDGMYHGTFVAGITAGDTYHGTGAEYPGWAPYYMGQGQAPESELFATKIFSDAGGFIGPEDYFEIVEKPMQQTDGEAYIHMNSWGASTDGDYTESDEDFDSAVRDANRETDENEPIVITASAGNDGARGDMSTGSPGNAKNVITVGATHSYMPDGSEYGGEDTNNAEDMAEGSSKGFTFDARVKPDVVSPGWDVMSQVGPPVTDEPTYGWSSGTSFSNPDAAGAASIIVEWYEEKFGERPSPAMVKALMINTAEPLDSDLSEDNRGPIPNQDQGWGHIDISKLEHPEGIGVSPREDQDILLETGDIEEYSVNWEDPDEPLKITLHWSDPPGSPGAWHQLQNNLDLEVVSPSGEIYRGNAFDLTGDGESDDGFTHPHPDGQPLEGRFFDFDDSGDGWDDTNNVLNVFIPPEKYEDLSWDIRVKGTNIPEDGNQDGDPNQDYALTVYNSPTRLPDKYGEISLNKEEYSGDDTVEITLEDYDLRGEMTYTVNLTSEVNGEIIDEEDVILEEEDIQGVFKGNIHTTEEKEDGALYVEHGAEITAWYQDEDPGHPDDYENNFQSSSQSNTIEDGDSNEFDYLSQEDIKFPDMNNLEDCVELNVDDTKERNRIFDKPDIDGEYEKREPIRIDSDEDFADQADEEDWPGDGSEDNPYIIGGYEIDGYKFGFGIFIGNTTHNFEVRDNYLYGASHNDVQYHWNTGVHLYNVTNGMIVNNTASSNENNGIYVQESHDNVIEENVVENNEDWGILVHDSNENTVVDNIVNHNGAQGIRLDHADNNTIMSNTVRDNDGDGILLWNSRDTIIRENTVEDSDSSGIEVYGGLVPRERAGYNIIKDNHLVNNYFQINLHETNFNTVENNTVIADQDYLRQRGHRGIRLNHVNNTVVTNNTATGHRYSGIQIARESYENHLENNTVSDNDWEGIVVMYGPSRNTIENNVVLNSGWSGIRAWQGMGDQPYNNTFVDNTVSQNSNHGIELYESPSNTVVNNTISDNDEYGIFMEEAPHNILEDNNIEENSISIVGNLIEYWDTHKIGTSNTVDGDPVYYWSNEDGGTIPTEAGQVILANSTEVTVENQEISAGDIGILIGFSDNNIIEDNSVKNNWAYGIRIFESHNNEFLSNTLSENEWYGMYAAESNDNEFVDNTLENNEYGLYLEGSENNLIYHNLFFENSIQGHDDGENSWDNGDPAEEGQGGNYWSDYELTHRGDGIGEEPYDISGDDNQDNYPWVDHWMLLPYERDTGVRQIITPTERAVMPNETIDIRAEVANFGEEDEEQVPVNYEIGTDDNEQEWSGTEYVDLDEGEYREIFFEEWNPPEEGQYYINVTADLEEDENPENDYMEESFEVKDIHDVGVTKIINPQEDVFNETQTVETTVENFGNVNQTDIPVEVEITYEETGEIEYFEETTVDLGAEPPLYEGESSTLTFANWTPSYTGDYTVNITTHMEGDQNPENDYSVKNVHVSPIEINFEATSIDAPEDPIYQYEQEILGTVTNIGNYPTDTQVEMIIERIDEENLLSEDFSDGLPAGWSVEDRDGSGNTWTDEYGDFMEVNPEYDNQHDILWSDTIDASQITESLSLEFYSEFDGVSSRNLLLSTDGGETYQQIRSDIESGLVEYDITEFAAGENEVMLGWEFHLEELTGDEYWQIDDVNIYGEYIGQEVYSDIGTTPELEPSKSYQIEFESWQPNEDVLPNDYLFTMETLHEEDEEPESSLISERKSVDYNQPPEYENPSPYDGEESVTHSPWLNVTVTDPSGYDLDIDWYLYESEGEDEWTEIGNITRLNRESGERHGVQFRFIDSNSTFKWQVEITEGYETVISENWTFSTYEPQPIWKTATASINTEPSEPAENLSVDWYSESQEEHGYVKTLEGNIVTWDSSPDDYVSDYIEEDVFFYDDVAEDKGYNTGTTSEEDIEWDIRDHGSVVGESAWDFGDEDYGAYESYQSWLISPEIELPEESPNIELSFNHWRDFYQFEDELRDGGNLRVSTDGPDGPWEIIEPEEGYDGTIYNGRNNPLGNEPGWGYEIEEWENVNFNLTDYEGQSIHLNWTAGIDDFTGNREGWRIDDIEITAEYPVSLEEPDADHYRLYRSEEEPKEWTENHQIAEIEADGSESYAYHDENKADDGEEWHYLVRTVDRVGNVEYNENSVMEPPLPEVNDIKPEDTSTVSEEVIELSAEVNSPIDEPLWVGFYDLETGELIDSNEGILDGITSVEWPLSVEEMAQEHEWYVVVSYEDYNIQVNTMSPPEIIDEEWEWLYDHEHRSEADNALGLTSPTTWYGGIRLDVEDRAGEFITEIAYYDWEAAGDWAQGKVATIEDDAVDEIVATSEEYEPTGAGWVELELEEALEIEENEYWILMNFDDYGDGYYPFGVSEPYVEDGGYINWDNPSNSEDWDDIGDFAWHIEANIAEMTDIQGHKFYWEDVIDPIAEAGEDFEAKQGDEIVLDGTASEDNIGITEYKWTIQDPMGEETVKYGETVEYTLEYALDYEVELIVYDEAENYDTDTIEIYAIDTEDPIADAGISDQIRLGDEFIFDGSGSMDNVEVVNWTWSIEGVAGEAEGYEEKLYGETADYYFPYTGTYDIELKVSDADGNSDTDKISVIVNPAVYELTTDVEGEGAIYPDHGYYEDGTEVKLTAVPAEGWKFVEWTGDYEDTEEEITITMDEDKEITAVFEEELEPAYFEVEITDYDDEVEEGDTVTIDFTVENTGELEGTQEIVFSVDDTEEDSMEITLDAGEEYNGEFEWETEDEGDYDLEVASEDTFDSVTVTVEEDEWWDIQGFTTILLVLGAVIAIAIYYKKEP